MKKTFSTLILTFSFITFLIGQGKFETKIGASYNFAFYNGYPSANYSSYLENPASKDGFGLTIKEEYFFLTFLSLQTGLELINTKIAFNEYTLSHNFGTAKYRHNLDIYELQIPLNIKFTSKDFKNFKGYLYGGIAYRTVPYASAKVNYLSGGQLGSGNIDARIHNNKFSPNLGLGIDYFNKEKKIGLFGEVCFKYLLGDYFYGGQKKYEWITDALIDNKRFVSIVLGVKF